MLLFGLALCAPFFPGEYARCAAPSVCVRRPGLEAHEFIESGAPADIMLLDIRMPVKSGTDVMRDCADLLPAYPVVCHVLALLH